MELAFMFLVISGYLIVGGTVFLTLVTLNRLNERIDSPESSSPRQTKSKRRRIAKRDLHLKYD